MSVLTEVILTASEPDWDDATLIDAPVRWINERLGDRCSLKRVPEEQAGGTKYFCHEIYLACFNHLDREEFLNLVRSAPWGNPAYVTLLWCRENPDDDGFVVAYQGQFENACR